MPGAKRKTPGNFDRRSTKGQGLVEYSLILVLVAIVVIAVLMELGPVVGNVFSKIDSCLPGMVCTSGTDEIMRTDTSPSNTDSVAIDSSEAWRLVYAFEDEYVNQETSILNAVNILGEATGPIIDALLQDAITRADEEQVQAILELKAEFEAHYPGSP